MSTTTKNLGLFKYDIVADENVPFSITNALNNNWDILDEAVKGGGSSRNVGEIIYSFLPLTDAGLHLLDGSLILGGGIYQGFVDYIAELYGNTETTWTQPVLTSNGVLGGDTFAVYASNNYDATTYPIYKSFDGNTSTIWYNSTAPVDVIFYNPKPLKVTNIQCQNRTDTSNYAFTAGTVYGSNDNVTYTEISTFTNSDTSQGGIWNIDLSSNTNSYLYYKISFSSATTNGVGANFTITATYINCPDYFTTEVLWQQSVITYGVCGKFVYDSVNNTVRLPKVTGIIEGTTDATALGDLVEAGLPAMTTGTAGGHNHSYTRYYSLEGGYTAQYNNGCFGGTGDVTSWNGDHTHTINTGVRTTDTVQPQTIKAFYYIVIANSTKTEIQVDIDEITTDLNGKADTDLTNITDTGYIKMAKASMPSNTYVDLTLGASGSTYTAPADGWFAGWTASSIDTGAYFTLMVGEVGNSYASEVYRESPYNFQCPILLPVKKGAVVTAQYTVGLSMFRFYYAVGSESEAS